jgi:hypothetical protein
MSLTVIALESLLPALDDLLSGVLAQPAKAKIETDTTPSSNLDFMFLLLRRLRFDAGVIG